MFQGITPWFQFFLQNELSFMTYLGFLWPWPGWLTSLSWDWRKFPQRFPPCSNPERVHLEISKKSLLGNCDIDFNFCYYQVWNFEPVQVRPKFFSEVNVWKHKKVNKIHQNWTKREYYTMLYHVIKYRDVSNWLLAKTFNQLTFDQKSIS